MEKKIQNITDQAENIVIIQADNPDADSLASALALEQILGDMGKKVHLYCGVSIPSYLRYLEGWDRVHLCRPAHAGPGADERGHDRSGRLDLPGL